MNTKFKLTKRQLIFTAVYLLASLLLSFLIYKNGFSSKSITYSDISFSAGDSSLGSETMSFPAGNYLTAVVAQVTADSRLVVYSGTDEVGSVDVSASDSLQEIDAAYTLSERTSDFRIAFLGDGCEDTTVDYVSFNCDRPINNDAAAKAVCAFIVLFFIYVMLMLFSLGILKKEQLIPVIILLAFSIFVSSPLMTDHLIYGHDLRCHTGRIDGIRNAFMDGQSLPMIIPDAFNGFGVLLFEYPWLFLLIPAFLRLCDVSMVLSYEIFLFMINIATAYVCFYSVRSVLNHMYSAGSTGGSTEGNTAGSLSRVVPVSLIVTIFYTLSTYRLSDVYIRAAMGEMLAMIFLPLLVAGLYHVCMGEKKKWYLLPIALTGILQSHILSCVLIIPLILLIVLPFLRQIFSEKRWIQMCISFASFIVINLWYIIPFIRFFRMPLNTDEFMQYWVTNNIVHLKDLFLSSVHTGFADDDRFTPSLGLCAAVCIVIIFIYAAVLIRDRQRKATAAGVSKNGAVMSVSSRLFSFLTAGTIVCIIISSEIIPWDFLEAHFPHLWKCIHMIQFPYRFLTIAMVCMIFALAVALMELRLSPKQFFPVLIVILAVSFYDSGTLMDIYENCGWVTFKTYSGGFVSYTPKDYLPAGINTETFNDTSPLISSGEITDYTKNGTVITFTYTSDEDAAATLPLNYYPCYKATLETGDKLSVSAWEDKRMLVILPAGDHTVTIRTSYLSCFR